MERRFTAAWTGRPALGVALLVMSVSSGCSFRVLTSQTVVLNGHRLVFERIDSLRVLGDQPIEKLTYDEGDFTILTDAGGILVNGFEVRSTDRGVQIHNQPFALGPGDTVHFDSDMEWTVESSGE